MDRKIVALPAGRLGRVARLTALGLRNGAGTVLGRPNEHLAEHAAEVLGTLRGLRAGAPRSARAAIRRSIEDAARDAVHESAPVRVLFRARAARRRGRLRRGRTDVSRRLAALETSVRIRVTTAGDDENGEA